MGLTTLNRVAKSKWILKAVVINDAIVKMAYWEPDKGIIALQLTVNLPVKRQARGKIVGTIIETSSEKINLWTCRGKVISFKGNVNWKTLGLFSYQFLPKLLFSIRVYQKCFLIPHLRHTCQVNDFRGRVNLFIAFSCLFCPPPFIV